MSYNVSRVPGKNVFASIGRAIASTMMFLVNRNLFLRLAMIVLTISTTSFVYLFQKSVFPEEGFLSFVPLISSASFVLVYFGLAFIHISEERAPEARRVAIIAAVVEGLYGTLFVMDHLSPGIITPNPMARDTASIALVVINALLHGAPFTILAYAIVRFISPVTQQKHAAQDDCMVETESDSDSSADLLLIQQPVALNQRIEHLLKRDPGISNAIIIATLKHVNESDVEARNRIAPAISRMRRKLSSTSSGASQ